MIPAWPKWIGRLLAVITFATVAASAVAQRGVVDVDPQPFRWRFTEASVGAYAEGSVEEIGYKDGFSSSYRRWFYGPLITLGVEGSIYHPNLFRYDIAGDFTAGWADETTTTSQGSTLRHSYYDYFGDFSGHATILANKPYRANVYATSGHTFRDYDFFNHVRVDSLRYGADSGYNKGPVPFTVSLARYEEETSDHADGISPDTTLEQTTLTLDSHNNRDSGNSTFNYFLNDYTRRVKSSPSSGSGSPPPSTYSVVSGIANTFGLSDQEYFGTAKRIEWRNNASYSTFDQTEGPETAAPNDSFTAGSHLAIQHPHNLSSTYDANYLRNDSDVVVTENSGGSAGVTHKLFSSLTSGLRVQATRYSSSREGGDFTSTEYLGAWDESYTKKLTASSRLSIGGSLGYSHTDQESSSTVQVVAERHTFEASGPVLNSCTLRLLNVDESTIEVWDEGRTIRYSRDLDYSVLNFSGRTVLQLIEPNSHGLTRTTPVLVDYAAASQGTGTIDGQFSSAQIRLDLFDNLLGIYGRYYGSHNSASGNIIVEDVTSLTVGADFSYKWFLAGVEYEIHDATFVSYTAVRLYQTFTFTPDEASTLNFTFTEGKTEYDNARSSETFYSAIGRYHRGLTRHFGLDIDAGASQRSGELVDQFQAAVRPGISYNIGQLSAKLAYDFEYRHSDISGEERLSNGFTLRVSRRF